MPRMHMYIIIALTDVNCFIVVLLIYIEILALLKSLVNFILHLSQVFAVSVYRSCFKRSIYIAVSADIVTRYSLRFV